MQGDADTLTIIYLKSGFHQNSTAPGLQNGTVKIVAITQETETGHGRHLSDPHRYLRLKLKYEP